MESPKRTKKGSTSSLSLTCRRWIVKFSTLRKPSQVILIIFLLSFVLLVAETIELMWSSPLSDLGRMNDSPSRHRGGRRNTRNVVAPSKSAVETINYQIYDKYGINSKESLQRFSSRTALKPLAPRVVRLNDERHTFKFAFPPGSVGAGKSGSFPLPQKGSRELRTRYIPLMLRNPKQMVAATPLGNAAGDCEAIDPSWQLAYHPNCNQIHEASGGWQKLYRMPTKGAIQNNTESDEQQREQIRLVNYGAFRHVWMIRDAHDGITKRAMKTLRSLKSSEKKFDLRNHDRHRRDAMSFEELHSSPLVVDLYASCSNSALFDFADKGDLLDIFEDDDGSNGVMGTTTPQADDEYKLHIMKIAYNVSMSVHDAHHFNSEGLPTMAHTDIKADQFIYQDGCYKLSDFNRVRFLTWDYKRNEQCGFKVGKNGGEYRSPEEYFYQPETEKVDVYSLGNVLYFLLTRSEVWEDVSHKQAYELVKSGKRPEFPKEIINSDGIFERHMLQAIQAAWIQKPEMRPGALEVANIIKDGLDRYSKRRINQK